MNIRFYHAKILVTGENKEFSILNGELWVENDSISYIGDGKELRNQKEDAVIFDREIDVEGNLLMPGFKDAHTHTAMTFLRSYADDLPLQEWLEKQVFPNEAKLTKEDVYYLAILGIMEYLTSGITSNFDMYNFPRSIAKASKDTGFRTVFCSGLNNFVSNLEELREDYNVINAMSPLTSFLPGIHAEYTTNQKLMEGLAKLAQELKAPVWMHNAETQKEVEECKARYGMTPTELTEALGFYEYGGGGYHCIWFTEHDFELFQKHDMTVVTNPASNLKLASGICPVKKFLDYGINVAIGTDGPASNNCLDMFREMFLTTGLAKVKEEDASCVSAEEVLYMATAGGAKAMQLPDCDRLAVGKKADLIMLDLKKPNMQPENNIVKNIVYAGSKQNVKMTMVNGKILYENGAFSIGFSEEEIYRRANEIINRIKG
ncbi:amidohydrolase [Roseburia hominis]|uniref:amidohydrolase n=1 Tax=Roseburia hominis TaxID=301301 RepID=UPI001F231466|nr:amidohydrolase [Roseburia hominis]